MQSPHTKAISPTGCRTRELLAVQQQCYPPTSLIIPIEAILLTPLGIYACCYKCTLNSNPLLPVYQQLNLQSGESSTRQTDMKYSQWKNRQLFRAAPAVRGKLCLLLQLVLGRLVGKHVTSGKVKGFGHG